MSNRILELKKLIGAIDGSQPKFTRPFSLFSQGMPASCLVELAGAGKTEFLSVFLKENPGLRTAWIEKKISINPYGLWQRGVNPKDILFVECDNETIWTAQQILRSQIFQVVVLSEIEFKEQDLRKFQLLIEKTDSHLVLLSTKAHQSWVPAVKIEMPTVSDGHFLTSTSDGTRIRSGI